MATNFPEFLPQEKGAIEALKEVMTRGDLSLLAIAWAGFFTAKLIRELPNNGECPLQGRIGSKRKNKLTPTKRADKIAEEMLKAGKSPQEIGAVVAAVLGWKG